MELHMTYTELASAAGGALLRGGGSDPVAALCLDSRKLAPGQVFWALRGGRFDGHSFLDERLAAEADGWVVRSGFPLPPALPRHVVSVPETLKALGSVAAHYRRRFKVPVVAITGSNGKTTTKEMLRAILALSGPVCASSGNFNNEIGLPLTVFEMNPRTRYAVFEMGASRRGDIAYLCAVAQPTLGILTNIGSAHLEFFGSLEGTFNAKTELVEWLKPDGPVVLNLDDPWLARAAEKIGARAVTFGRHPRARVKVLDAPPGVIELALPTGRVRVSLDGAGLVHRMNAAAAAAAAHALGLGAEAIREGLSRFVPAPLRFQKRRHPSGAWLVMDAYNANPESMRAGIQTFLDASDADERILVLGDMKELGPESPRLHRELGTWLTGLKLGGVYLAGPEMRQAAEALGAASAAFPVLHAGEPAGLAQALRARLKEGVSAFFKGSRAMRLEDLADSL